MRTKITGTQFALLLLLSRMCSLFIFTPVFNSVQTSTAMLVGNLVSMVIQILILIPISMFWNKNPNVSILDYLLSKNKIISKIIIFSFLGFFIFQAINTLFHFEFFLSNTAYPKVSALPIILLITICCVYTAKLGIEGICRGGFIIFFIFLIGLISIFALTMKYFDILNIIGGTNMKRKELIKRIAAITLSTMVAGNFLMSGSPFYAEALVA
ncbi:MAG: GerAB/ArcD/ProY family transporter, partial [Oscillospiraceae bacterium]